MIRPQPRLLALARQTRPFSRSAFLAEPRKTDNTDTPVASPPATSTTISTTLFTRIQASPLGRALLWYGDKQKKRPYWTQFWSTVTIFLLSDFSAQLLVPWITSDDEEEEDSQDEDAASKSIWAKYDPIRTIRHVSIGGFVSIPSYTWFMFVHNHFNYPSKFLSIFTKVALSQLIYAPLFNIYFFSAQSLLSGAGWDETLHRLAITLPVSILNSAKIWPAVSAFMFLYIDPAFRAIFAGTIALGWQTYLSWLNQVAAREMKVEREREKENERMVDVKGKGMVEV